MKPCCRQNRKQNQIACYKELLVSIKVHFKQFTQSHISSSRSVTEDNEWKQRATFSLFEITPVQTRMFRSVYHLITMKCSTLIFLQRTGHILTTNEALHDEILIKLPDRNVAIIVTISVIWAPRLQLESHRSVSPTKHFLKLHLM